MPEKFSSRKAFDLSPSAVGKSASIWVKGFIPVLFLALLGFTIWRAFFQEKTTQNVTVEKGAQAQFTTINKASRWFVLFTELGVENRGGDLGAYTRAGARVEF